ncbi:MAG: ABC transporter permease subunit [Deinococcota bacterium]|nr:ABC transporter permease subunit [Deinococcota bacterium]
MLLAILLSAFAGVLGVLAVRAVTPAAPAYIGLIFFVVALVAILLVIARRYQWIMPWYYLLPAILFLMTFTLMPVGLTVYLAFTDYAGIRNNQLNPTTETAITSAQETLVTVDNIRGLNCEALFRGCTDVRARVYASGTITAQGLRLEGTQLVLETAPPPDRAVTAVRLRLVDLGIRAQFPVVARDGNVLTLGREPPGAADLSGIVLELDRAGLERVIVSTEGNLLTLNEPLPEGLQYEALTRYNDFSLIGWSNFRAILSQANRALWPVFTWNITFAVLTILINTTIGVFLAVLLNNPELRFRNLYRTLLIIPWALPAVITIQVWRGFLNANFGAINRLLALLDLPTPDWLGDPLSAKAAVLLVNLWLGLPFMMTATLGALSAIPRELYEASKIDGASPWQAFWGVTAPLLRTALVPITLTGFAFNFNNFNVIFLLTDGGPAYEGGTSTARSTDILISWAYNEAFRSQGGFAYGLGSAISILIFIITLAVSLVNFRVTGALKEEDNT